MIPSTSRTTRMEIIVPLAARSRSLPTPRIFPSVTVIYGHNVDGIFATLHYFEDAEFFKQNDTFYVYTPGHILTYEVVSAYEYDGRHILNSFDFDRALVREEYFASVLNPNSVVRNVREGVESRL